ncbi:hypothetical protein D3C72_1750410 [compost metagenome]
MPYHAPSPLRLQDPKLSAVWLERADTAKIIGIQVNKQALADQIRAARKDVACVAHTIQVDVRSNALLEICSYGATLGRLH